MSHPEDSRWQEHLRKLELQPGKDLQSQVDEAVKNGYLHVILPQSAEFRPSQPRSALLRLDGKHQGLVFEGASSTSLSLLNGNNEVAHVIHLTDGAKNVTIANVEIYGGSTVEKSSRAETAKEFASTIYEKVDGAGVLITGDVSATFRNCIVRNNNAVVCGGGFSLQQYGENLSPILIDGCTFFENIAGHTGGAIDVLTPSSFAIIRNSTFMENSSNLLTSVGGPHGGITVFPDSFAVIEGCHFFTSEERFDATTQLAIDYQRGRGGVVARENIFHGYDQPIAFAGEDLDSRNIPAVLKHLELLSDLWLEQLSQRSIVSPFVHRGQAQEVERIRQTFVKQYGAAYLVE